jgi:hypothetical protein
MEASEDHSQLRHVVASSRDIKRKRQLLSLLFSITMDFSRKPHIMAMAQSDMYSNLMV